MSLPGVEVPWCTPLPSHPEAGRPVRVYTSWNLSLPSRSMADFDVRLHRNDRDLSSMTVVDSPALASPRHQQCLLRMPYNYL